MGTWALLKDIAKKKLSRDTDKDRERVDNDLPLGIRIGGMLNITSADFILAEGQLHIESPKGDLYVVSYGQFRLGEFKGHRFYLSEDDDLFMLQIITDDDNGIGVDDITLYKLYDELFTDDWSFWLDDSDGYIGLSEFDLPPAPTTFYRVWDNEVEQVELNDGLTHIPPVNFKETIYLDAYGDGIEHVQHACMLYGRDVDENVKEYVIVSADEDKEGASIPITVGVPLIEQDIKVLF